MEKTFLYLQIIKSESFIDGLQEIVNFILKKNIHNSTTEIIYSKYLKK